MRLGGFLAIPALPATACPSLDEIFTMIIEDILLRYSPVGIMITPYTYA